MQVRRTDYDETLESQIAQSTPTPYRTARTTKPNPKYFDTVTFNQFIRKLTSSKWLKGKSKLLEEVKHVMNSNLVKGKKKEETVG